jgi:hypothetical protein
VYDVHYTTANRRSILLHKTPILSFDHSDLLDMLLGSYQKILKESTLHDSIRLYYSFRTTKNSSF